jgi:hypothetical protein
MGCGYVKMTRNTKNTEKKTDIKIPNAKNLPKKYKMLIQSGSLLTIIEADSQFESSSTFD